LAALSHARTARSTSRTASSAESPGPGARDRCAARSGPVGGGGSSEGGFRRRYHGHGTAGHVKKLDAVAVLFARDDVALDDRPHVAGAKPAFRKVDRQDRVLVEVEGRSITPGTL